MTNGAIEVITSVQRRRRWPRAEKERIVAAALAPGAVASEVARVAGIHEPAVSVAAAAAVRSGGGFGELLCCCDCAGCRSRTGSGTIDDRDRVCRRHAHADHRHGRSGHRVGADRGAGEDRAATMIPSGVRVWLATGHTDMRKGFDGLAVLVQEQLRRDPHGGHLFVFRGRRGGLIKVLWHDGQGMCLFAKRLERGRFIWPSPADGLVTITPAQLGYLLEGIDWRMPQQTWRPQAAG